MCESFHYTAESFDALDDLRKLVVGELTARELEFSPIRAALMSSAKLEALEEWLDAKLRNDSRQTPESAAA